MRAEELYEALWEHFIVFERGLDPDRQVALDSCIEAASRKLAAKERDDAHSQITC
jgi:hypothetical protein